MQRLIQIELQQHLELLKKVMELMPSEIEAAGQLVINAITEGKKVILMGNGGSAADAQHIAAEFVGRFRKERRGLPAIALTTDTSALTSIGNDYGYDVVFRRQLEAIGQKGDVVIGITTSGNSPNIVKALAYAQQNAMVTIGLLGKDGGKSVEFCNEALVIPSDNTARIQEMHILIGHIFCEMVDRVIF